MNTNAASKNSINEAQNLRQKAEGLLKKKLLKTSSKLSVAEAQKLIHELQVHQIELELQNEELILAKEQAEVASGKYVAERQQAEEEQLESSEENFRFLYENAKIGLYRTTPDGTIVLANKALVAMLGYPSFAELAKRNLEQDGFETPSQRKAFIEKIEQTGEVENFESTWIRQDRAPVFVRESARAIRDSNGNTLYYDGTMEDITTRKQAEEALIESEEKYRALFETSLDGISLLDLNGKIIFANKQVVKLFGYNQPSEFIGLNGFGLIHPEDKPKMDRYFKEFMTSGFITNCEIRSVKKDGSEFIGEYSATIIKNANGDPVYMMDVVRDITGRKRVEEALRESEARYRLLFEASADGILIADVETKAFKYANPAVCRMLGYAEKELTTLGLADIHPGKDLQRVIAEFESQARGEKILASDIPCLKKDGSIMYVDISTTPTIIDGRLCTVGLFRDITERKQAEEALKKSELRFKQISENAQESIWEVDSNGLYTYISPVVKELLGYDADEIIGLKYFYDLFEPENKEEMKQGALGAFARKESFRNFINCNIHKDGRKVILSTSGVPILDKENNLIGYRGVDVDITERVHAEKALLESEAKLISAMKIAKLSSWEYNYALNRFTFNDQFYSLFHTTAEREGGYTMSSLHFAQRFVYQADQVMLKNEMRKALETSDPAYSSHIEYRVIYATGEMGYFISSIRIEKDADNRTIKAYGVNQDITERKQIEGSLLRINKAVESSSDAICMSDPQGHHFYHNKAFTEIFEYTVEELAGAGGGFAVYANKDIARKVFETIMGGGSWIGEVEMLSKSRRKFIILLRADSIKDENGVIVGLVGIHTDITERKQVEEALRLSELRFKQVSENAREWIWEVDENGFFTYASPVVKEILGYEPEEIVGKKHFYDLFNDEDSVKVKQVASDLYARKNSFKNLIHSDLHKDGREVIISSSGVPLFDNKANLLGYRGLNVDITKQRHAEKALRESEQRYRLLIETVNEGILVAQNGFLKFVNPMMQEITGFTQEELLSLPFINYVYPEDRKIVISNHMKRLKGEQFLPRYQFRIIKKDGSTRRIEMNGIIIEWEGRSATLNMLTDITERQQAEEALQHERILLRLLIDNVPDLMYTKDTACRKTLVNIADVQNMGVKLESEVLGKDDFAFFPKEMAEKFYADDQSVIQTGQPLINKEEYTLNELGQEKWLLTSKFPLRDQSGQIIGLAGIGRDITERKRAEEALYYERTLLRQLIDNVPDYIFTKDIACRKTLANIADVRHMGAKSEAEVLG